jgi:hypothetical protein
MWQEQLISIVEENSLDSDHIADLLVTYEAETGDESLRGCGEVLMFVGALRPWSGYGSGSRSCSRSWSVSESRSGSRFRSRSWSGSWSRSWSSSGSRSGSRLFKR